jgi:hypothetical protein
MSKAVPAEDIYFFERERWPRMYAAIGAYTPAAERVPS